MQNESSINEDYETLKKELAALEREIELKEKMNATLKKSSDVIAQRQVLHKKRIAQLEKKVKQLMQARQENESSAILAPSSQESQKIKTLTEQNIYLTRKIKQLEEKHQSQINELRSQLKSRIENASKVKDIFDIPSQMLQISKIRDTKEKIEAETTVDITTVVKVEQPSKEVKGVNTQPYPESLPNQTFKKRQKSRIQQIPYISLSKERSRQKVMEEEPESDSIKIMFNSENPKSFNIDDDDFEISQRVAPGNKKIMQSIIQHAEAIDADKKWAFYNMLCAWAETRIEGICESLDDIQN